MSFPEPLQLEGEKNFLEWKDAIILYCEQHGLKQHLDGTATMPVTVIGKQVFNRNRLTCLVMLIATTKQIRWRLVAAGLRYNEGDPHVLYQLILRNVFPKIANRADEVWEQLFALKLERGMALAVFAERFDRLTRKLDNLECGLTDKAKTLQVLAAVKGRYPTWDMYFRRLFRNGELTWPRLQHDIINLAKSEPSRQVDGRDFRE